MTDKEMMDALQAPFPPDDIEWRAQSSGYDKNGNPWALIMPYVTNRGVQNRLDEVFGVLGWSNEYKEVYQGDKISFKCGITVVHPNHPHVNITKWDGADQTDFESFKGGLSNSMKRSAVQWGIGRYLYNLDTCFADLTEDRNSRFNVSLKDKDGKKKRYYYNAPELPSWALPDGTIQRKPASPTPTQQEPVQDILGGKTLTALANECTTLEELKDFFMKYQKLLKGDDLKSLTSVKDARKAELEGSGTNEPIYTLEVLKENNIPKLQEICKGMNITGYSKMSKGDLINIILKTQNQ